MSKIDCLWRARGLGGEQMKPFFECGKIYENRIGKYQVMKIAGGRMLVRYDSGKEQILTIELQRQYYLVREKATRDQEYKLQQSKWMEFANIFSRDNSCSIDDIFHYHFRDTEMLTKNEWYCVIRWGDFYADLLSGKESSNSNARGDFLRCADGQKRPETDHEWAITVLVHQALRLGGVYESWGSTGYGEEHTDPFEWPEKFENDIILMRGSKLYGYLRRLGEAAAEVSRQINKGKNESWESSFDDMSGDLIDGNDDDGEKAQMLNDIFSDADDLSRSHSDGWFYEEG